MKITAYKDSTGKVHESKLEWEIAELEAELKITQPKEVDEIIIYGKKAQRLKKLYESRESSTDNK